MSKYRRDATSIVKLPIASSIICTILIIIIMINCVYCINELCPGRCKCEDEFLRAACVFASLEVVPIQLNPEIKHLDLSNNRIGSLTLAFGFYDNLETLDLSSNVIHTLGNENFLLQKRLLYLNISNNGIKTISKSALKGLESLNILDLSNNNISDMDSQAFRYANELDNVNLSGNSLINLPEGLLKNLHRIKILKLHDNSLLQVPKTNLILAPSLQLLDLSDNLILEIGHDSIPILRSLITLNLSNNIINYINDNAFDRLPSLINLNLNGNNLTAMPTDSLSRLTVLSHLILSRNPLLKLNSIAFRNLFELKILDLRYCNIIYIDQRAFTDNINLEKLLLDGNHQLQYLPSRVLYNARYLNFVSLRNCKLLTLQPTHFPVDDLKILRLGGNPFVCNCSLNWLWNVIHTDDKRNTTKLLIDSNEIICNDSQFNGTLLINLTENSLRCRLSVLYLILLSIGCLTATVTILILIGWITRIKRRKRLPFTPPNRPELLVYVGTNQNNSRKNFIKQQYSGDRRLYKSNSDIMYDLPINTNNKNIIDVRSNYNYNINSNSNSLYENPHDYSHNPSGSSYLNSNDNTNNIHYNNINDKNINCHDNIDGVYAVTDVMGIIDNNMTDDKHYKINNHHEQTPFSSSNNSDYDLDYEYDYHHNVTDNANNQKPHVVFV